MDRMDTTRLIALLECIKRIYPERFNDIEITIGYGPTRYAYKYNNETESIENPKIIIGARESKEFEEFIIGYYNQKFDMNLENNEKTRLIQEVCHEAGHHYNIDYYKYRDDEYFEQLNCLDEYGLEGEERRVAYREIDEEADADKFAAYLMKHHLNDFLACFE